jgi:hypothetical protein
MRKQYREPGTELAPLEYVVAKQEREKERSLQAAPGLGVTAVEEAGQYGDL